MKEVAKITYVDIHCSIINRIVELAELLGTDDITYRARVEELLYIDNKLKGLYKEEGN